MIHRRPTSVLRMLKLHLALVISLFVPAVVAAAQEERSDSVAVKTQHANEEQASKVDLQHQKNVVAESFAKTHDGWSADEIVLRDQLNAEFIAACKEQIPDADSTSLNWTLLNLRKAGKLTSKATRRSRATCESANHVAEIVARSMQDKHQVSFDRLMCDSEIRHEFNELSKRIAPELDPYDVRKSAFRLRKTRKLKPELITRIADWGRTVTEYTASDLRENPELVEQHPGVYIFRDASGYLYIGQTENLRERMVAHLDVSHNESLANYLAENDCENITIEIHAFDPESQARKTMVRRAYESGLIASRKPRFNVQP